MLTSHGCFWISEPTERWSFGRERSILPRRLRLDRHLRAGNISCGCASIPGAISSVTIAGRNSHTRTIGGLPAIGICGSGILEAVSGMKKGDRGRKRHLCGGYPGGWICPKYAGQSGKDLFDTGRHPAVSDGKSGDRRRAEDPVKSGWYGGLAGKKVYLAGGMGTFFKCARSGRDRSGGKSFCRWQKPEGILLQGAVSYLKKTGQEQILEKDKLKEITEKMQVLMLGGYAGLADAYISHMALTEFKA